MPRRPARSRARRTAPSSTDLSAGVPRAKAEARGAKVDGRPAKAAGREFQWLVDIMRRLRGPRGCPWDREQTIESLRGFVLEETYEVLDAIDRADHAALLGEIGDLLFEGVFLAQIAADERHFTV